MIETVDSGTLGPLSSQEPQSIYTFESGKLARMKKKRQLLKKSFRFSDK